MTYEVPADIVKEYENNLEYLKLHKGENEQKDEGAEFAIARYLFIRERLDQAIEVIEDVDPITYDNSIYIKVDSVVRKARANR